ncbi:MAG: 6-pyruvoyl-tetrahydropterin synthase-related protein, partial [Candidatus Levyibacteriota bacterium]
MKTLNRLLPTLVVIAFCYWSIAPLFHPGFFPIHDGEQVGRLHELHLDVVSGQLPPRLSQNLGYGYDYPLFNFYPSFVYYIAEVYHLLGFSYISSIKIMIATGFLLAAIGMYWLSRYYFGRLAGVISAVLYTYASYHSVDVYVRGALPEFWSFVFFPFIFLGFTKIAEKPRTLWTIVTGVLLACFVLTHNLIAMMSSPFILGFLIYLVMITKEKKQFIHSVLISGTLGVLLSAYFWLPSLAEKHNTMVNLLTKELADYSLYFVYPIQFWHSPWGYGGSVPGMGDGISFQIGKVYFLSIIAVFVYALFLFKKYRKTAVLLFLLIFLFVFSLFMQISASKFIW